MKTSLRRSLALATLTLLSACATSDTATRVPDARSTPSMQTAAAGEGAASAADAETAAIPEREAQIIRGTGRMVRTPAVRQAEVTESGEITLSFSDVAIREVAQAVLGEIMGVNYAVHPDVQGSVTLETRRPIPRSAVLPMLGSVMGLSGAALVQTADGYRIVPEQLASRQAPIRVGAGIPDSARGYAVQVVPLQFVSALEMSKILEPMASGGSILRTDTQRNLLILAGNQRQLEALLETVQVFDVDWLAGMSFGLFPLQYSDVKSVVDDLKAVFGDEEKMGPLSGILNFVPVERLNAVLVISPQPKYLDHVSDWIEKFDGAGGETGTRLFVYKVKHGRAVDMAAVLAEMFSGQPSARTGDLSLAPGMDPATLRSRPGGDGAGAGSSDQPSMYSVSGNSDIRIIGDPSRNAVLVFASPSDYKMIERALIELDILPLQVLIEATIAEVTLNEDLRYGVRGFFETGKHTLTLSDSVTGTVSPLPGFSYVFEGDDGKAVIDALDEVTDVNVISSPQVMVLNNQTATLQVGDQVPIATQAAVSVTDPDAPIVNSIELIDTGVVLEVTPRVNPGGLVIMDIQQETSTPIETTTSAINSPTIQQRRITSTVAIQGNETIALGGLIRDSRTKFRSGIPLLSSIPVLGALFRSTSDIQSRTELLILITPRVIENQQQARDVTEELRGRLRAIRDLEQKIE